MSNTAGKKITTGIEAKGRYLMYFIYLLMNPKAEDCERLILGFSCYLKYVLE